MELKNLRAEIRKISEVIKDRAPKDFSQDKKSICLGMLTSLIENTEIYDKYSTLTKDTQGHEFETKIKNKNSVTADDIIWIMIFLSRIARELEIKAPDSLNIHAKDILRLYDYKKADPNKTTSDEQENIKYIAFKMEKYIVDEKINQLSKLEQSFSEKIAQIQGNFENKVKEYTEKLGTWDKKVSDHEETLKKANETYSFIELNVAYKKILDDKNNEKIKAMRWAIIFGFLLVLPIIAAGFIDFSPVFSKPWNWAALLHFFKLLPLAAAEIILLYYFRILLHNYYSVKSLVLQLEHRRALCQFIQSYIDFAIDKDPDKKANEHLSRFEALIFKELTPDTNIPSTIDLINQVTKLVRSS